MDQNYSTGLHHAVLINSLDICNLLLHFNCNYAMENSDGQTALDLAFRDKRHEIMEVHILRRH